MFFDYEDCIRFGEVIGDGCFRRQCRAGTVTTFNIVIYLCGDAISVSNALPVRFPRKCYIQ